MKGSKIKIGYALNKVEKGDNELINLQAYSSECKVETDISFELAHTYKDHKLRLACDAELRCKNIVFAHFSIKCYFDIERTSWEQLSENYTKEVTLPSGFISHILSISISTLRGYIFAKTEDLDIDRQITISLFDTDAFVKDNFSDGYIIPKDLH